MGTSACTTRSSRVLTLQASTRPTSAEVSSHRHRTRSPPVMSYATAAIRHCRENASARRRTSASSTEIRKRTASMPEGYGRSPTKHSVIASRRHDERRIEFCSHRTCDRLCKQPTHRVLTRCQCHGRAPVGVQTPRTSCPRRRREGRRTHSPPQSRGLRRKPRPPGQRRTTGHVVMKFRTRKSGKPIRAVLLSTATPRPNIRAAKAAKHGRPHRY